MKADVKNHGTAATRTHLKGGTMHRAFEAYIRLKYGRRYSLEKDCEGIYVRETVRRMYEVWCDCKRKYH